MAQNRKAPSYQEYAASILANRYYRCMNLAERGLLFALRLECWENENLPSDKNQLAKYLGVELGELNGAFTENVRTFFMIDGDTLTCPELDDYRQHLNEQKAKQSAGGKKGAAKTNAKYSSAGNSQVPRRDSRESLVKYSLDQLSKTQSLENGHLTESNNDEWLDDYDKASNGD